MRAALAVVLFAAVGGTCDSMMVEDRPAPRYDLACEDGSAAWYCSCKNKHGQPYKPQRMCLDAGAVELDAIKALTDLSCVAVLECHQAGEGTKTPQSEARRAP
jgi:hypothetical protein